MTITNIYLSPSEYAVLARLDAFELRKRRHPLEGAHADGSCDRYLARRRAGRFTVRVQARRTDCTLPAS